MMAIAIVSLLIGAVFGLRLKIWILIPAIFFDLILIVCIGVAQANDIWWIGLALIVGPTALQIGYFGGTATRLFLAASRASRRSDQQTSPAIP